jgi:lysophospholipase L1-like esterase
MITRLSLGGERIRVTVSNMLGAQPLIIGAVHAALAADAGGIQEQTDRTVTFARKPSVVVPPGAVWVSDPVDLKVPPLGDLAISLYLPEDTGPPTTHTVGLRRAYIVPGDATSRSRLADATETYAYLWLSSVDVLAPAETFTIVALGDSITDGYATTRDANQAWPALLAARLAGNQRTRHVGVVNQGISGNQLLRNGAGLSALARFDRDVLTRAGAGWVILLEGINDINIRGRSEAAGALTAEDLIGGYEQIIARARAAGLQVMGATLTPQEGQRTATERTESIRQAVNQWIRTAKGFDAVVDFDAVLRDPTRPARLRPEFDPGDHIHPNDAGNQAMAQAFDLAVFRQSAGR